VQKHEEDLRKLREISQELKHQFKLVNKHRKELKHRITVNRRVLDAYERQTEEEHDALENSSKVMKVLSPIVDMYQDQQNAELVKSHRSISKAVKNQLDAARKRPSSSQEGDD